MFALRRAAPVGSARAGPWLQHGALQTRSIWFWDLFTKRRRDRKLSEYYDPYKNRFIYQDMRELKAWNGKFFEAVDHMVPSRLCYKFPRIKGQTLSGRDVEFPKQFKGQTSIFMVFFNQFSANAMASWRDMIDTKLDKEKNIKFYELAIDDNWLSSRSKGRVENALKGMLPQERIDRWILLRGNRLGFRRRMGLRNRCNAYIFLVDHRGVVRWRAHGPPTAAEEATLQKSAMELARQARKYRPGFRWASGFRNELILRLRARIGLE